MINFCNYKNYLINGTFVEPNIASDSFKYYKGSEVKGWTFNNSIIVNNSKTWGYPMPYPCGNQACTIQSISSISQTFSVPKVGKYSLVILFVGRNCCDKSGLGNNLNFMLNGKQVGIIENPSVNTWNTRVIKLNLTTITNNKLDIIGISKTDRSTAIQLILTDQIQDITKGFRSKTKSDGSKTKSDGSITKPDGSITKPDGSITKPDGSITKPDGSITKPDGSITKPDGSITKPDESMQKDFRFNPNSFRFMPKSVKSKISDGSITKPKIPITKPEIPMVEPEIPMVEPEIPMLKSEIPIRNPDGPIVKSDISKNVDFNYNVNSVRIYVLGNYGIAPWGKNTNFPDDLCKWIWYSQEANSNSPNNTNSPRTIQYIYSNKSEIVLDVNLNIIVDDKCEVFLNSVLVKRNNNQLLAVGGWEQGSNTWNIFPCKIQPGENLFEFKVINGGGPGGLLVSAINVGDNKVLFHTDNTWKFIPIPIKPITSCSLSQQGLITTIDKSFPWGCLTLNGSPTQYVIIGKTITEMRGLTFGCWFRSNSNIDLTSIIDFGNGRNNNNISLYIKNNKLGVNVLLTNINKPIDDISPPINDNKWHHVVWTILPTLSGATYNIYLNNNMVFVAQGDYPINMERENCYLGKSNINSNSNSNFSGSLSNFVMYQKVLSTKEIKGLYMSMINLNDPTLYIYLPFSTNSVLDTLLNNYAGKTFSFPIITSKVENENWTCIEEEKNKWIGVKMEDSKPICMSMDGKNCIMKETKKECNIRISNPILPSNPIICGGSQMNLSWCDMAKKQLTQPNLIMDKLDINLKGTPIADIKPGVKALNALEINIGEKSLNNKPLQGGGQILSITNMNDVNTLMIGGTFKLRVNLPMMPPYIKGKTFDVNKGVNPNYFYLCVEKLDNNCNIKTANGTCIATFADDKKCDIKALTSYTQFNTWRLVLVSSEYVLNSSIQIGKNSDFTLVQVNNQIYLKNIQTGYLPSLYSNEMVLPIYGDMEVKSNSNVNKVYSQLTNTLCTQEVPPVQTEGTSFVKCDIKQDPGTYLITTENIGSSSPIRININQDKTISLNLLTFNTYGYPTKVYNITSCNFNINTYAYIEKMTNALGTFLINMVCFEDTQNNNSNPKNQLKFTVELVNFPKNFIKDNSIFNIN
jgi:hypothetical protein